MRKFYAVLFLSLTLAGPVSATVCDELINTMVAIDRYIEEMEFKLQSQKKNLDQTAQPTKSDLDLYDKNLKLLEKAKTALDAENSKIKQQCSGKSKTSC